MIVNRALTLKEQDAAQWSYIKYSGLGLVCVTCSGMTIQILLALYLGVSDTAVSCLGAFEYLKYLILPLGFVFVAKYGVARSLGNYATVSSIICFIIAIAALMPLLGLAPAGIPLFFLGLFLLCGTSACSVATNFTLHKNITNDQTLPRMSSRIQQVNAAAGLLANLSIAGLFTVVSNAVALPLLYCVAAILFYLNGRQIVHMPEPSVMRSFASQPILPQIKKAWSNSLIRRILYVGTVQNLVFVTLVPVNLLAVKRGCGIDNTHVLILTSIQLVTMFVISFGYRSFCTKFGPRKAMILTCPFVWMIAAFWIFVPANCSFGFLVIPFMLISVLNIGFCIAMGNYIVMAVPNELQIGASVLVFLFHGGVVGLIGIISNPALFRIISLFCGSEPLALYRWYFLITGLVSIPGIFAFISLPVLYLQCRMQKNG